MHETDATTITSLRVKSDDVVESRSRAMSSFRELSFSM